MTKPFRTGLIVGKFAPLHLGHEFLIRTAQAQCDQLYIISYSNPEFAGCEPVRRKKWLARQFPHVTSLVVTPELVQVWRSNGKQIDRLPENSDSDLAHRRFVAQICLEILQVTAEVVFTSEGYGEGFAEHLTYEFKRVGAGRVTHVEVDTSRQNVPISATRLRADIHGLHHYMAPAVYSDFVQRICLLGGESTGKSVLASELARILDTSFVAEYGREYWESRGGQLDYIDMQVIAREQVRQEEEKAMLANQFLVCDTSPLTTLFYSYELFGRAEQELVELAKRRYDIIFLCSPDFCFVQDRTRKGPEFRARQHSWYKDELGARKLSYRLLSGNIDERVNQVFECVGKLPTVLS